MTVLYTVQEAADLLKLHPKTVLKKVQRGELSASKVGRQYRLSFDVLNDFVGGTLQHPGHPTVSTSRQASASTVIDIDAISPEESSRLTNTAMAALQGGHDGVRVDCLYYEELGKLKVIMHGSIADARDMLSMFATLLDQPGD